MLGLETRLYWKLKPSPVLGALCHVAPWLLERRQQPHSQAPYPPAAYRWVWLPGVWDCHICGLASLLDDGRHLGACWKCRNAPPRPTEHSLLSHKISIWFVCKLELESLCPHMGGWVSYNFECISSPARNWTDVFKIIADF